MGYVLEVAYKHGVGVKLLRTDTDIADFLDELMAAGWEYTSATVHAVPDGSVADPDHEMAVGVDAASGLGAVRWSGDGTYYTKGDCTNPNGVEYAYFGTGHDFPPNSEVPLETVRLAMWQLLAGQGKRPAGMAWQEWE